MSKDLSAANERDLMYYQNGLLKAEIERLRSLVEHCWIHSGYQNCGYAKMTAEEKELFDDITGSPQRANQEDKP